MERKQKPDTYIEPMPRSDFLRLMREFKKIGGKYVSSKESEEYLQKKNAEAITVDGYTIVFKRRPTRAAVYEELFHAKQFREGKIDGSVRNRIVCEIEAQKYLLDNADNFKLSAPEIIHTRDLLKGYEEALAKREEVSHDDMQCFRLHADRR